MFLLTAAHCVSIYDKEKDEIILMDKVDLYYQYTNLNHGERYICDKWFVHPKYDGTPLCGYDVALLVFNKEDSKEWRAWHTHKGRN